jgi:hypothetical protein
VVEEVFDGGQPHALKVGRAPWPDALQILERGCERIHLDSVLPYCTTVACALPTRISRIPEGSSNSSSMLNPAGFSGVFE